MYGGAQTCCGPRAQNPPMNNSPSAQRLKSLADCADVASLSSAVRQLCSEFGKVTHIDVLTLAETESRRALCFLRLESMAQEQQLMAMLSATRFGDDVLLVVDLPRAAPRAYS